jgi:DNA repair protein RecO (recombination protein O)
MEWQDSGVVLSVRPYGETSAIVELFTRHYGRHLGLVKGGRSRIHRPILQIGNIIRAIWRARLEEHLGFYTVEAQELRAARLMETKAATVGLSYMASLARLLPERDPHSELFDIFNAVVNHLDDPALGALYVVRFEMRILTELGFGLDLNECALTGQTEGLAYVSPKTGRAVCAEAAAPWIARLLPLPPFLLINEITGKFGSPQEVELGAQLTGFFLNRHIYKPRNMPEPGARASYFAMFR